MEKKNERIIDTKYGKFIFEVFEENKYGQGVMVQLDDVIAGHIEVGHVHCKNIWDMSENQLIDLVFDALEDNED